MDPMVSMLLVEHLKNAMHYPNVTDLKIIYRTTLTPSDINDSQSWFAMPRNQILTPFLTHSEDLFLQWKTEDGTNTMIPVNVVVGFTEYKLSLSRCSDSDPDKSELKIIDSKNKKRKKNCNNEDDDKNNGGQQEKEKSCRRWSYVLNGGGWSQLKTEKQLQCGDLIQVMSFRSHNHDIGFLISHTPRDRVV